jgi:gamma-butyrobetaine dioxygenase
MEPAIGELTQLFAGAGTRDYFGEPISTAEHMLQAGSLAEAAGAEEHLVAAALLHDVGHFQGELTGRDLMAGTDNRHSQVGADWLAEWFGPEVTEPVRLHVAAKRYLCKVETRYFDLLSAASVYTLEVQGGPMDAEEVAAFEALPSFSDAVALRRWDDQAKDPKAIGHDLSHFQSLLERLLVMADRLPPRGAGPSGCEVRSRR